MKMFNKQNFVAVILKHSTVICRSFLLYNISSSCNDVNN